VRFIVGEAIGFILLVVLALILGCAKEFDSDDEEQTAF
jgi:hypothetical protein